MGHWALRVASHSRHGGGHLARARVLANALCGVGEAVTLVLDDGADVAKRIVLQDGLSFCSVSDAFDIRFSGVVLDGYEILRNEATRWISYSAPVAVIDDFLDPPVGVSLVVNGAPHLSGKEVRGIPALLGSRYAMIDPRYAAIPNRDRSKPVRRVLVSFGLLDPDNLTSLVLEALATLPYPPIADVLLSSASEHQDAVAASLKRLKNSSTLTLDAPSSIEHLAQADLAIGAGGVSLLERMAAGVPSVSVAIIDNQRLFVEGAAHAGGTIGVGDVHAASRRFLENVIKDVLSNASLRREMALAAKRIVDGDGSMRVAKELVRLLRH